MSKRINVFASGSMRGEIKRQLQNIVDVDNVVEAVAVMPDVHLSAGGNVGFPIGTVVVTKGAVFPSAVGVDIGCGVSAVPTKLQLTDAVADKLPLLLSLFAETIPAGQPQRGKPNNGMHVERQDGPLINALMARAVLLPGVPGDRRNMFLDRAWRQFGTVGGGNHFLELGVDKSDGMIWLLVHSGSRAPGHIIAEFHQKRATQLFDHVVHSPLPDKLCYLTVNTHYFDEYMESMRWAASYAVANRQQICTTALDIIRRVLGLHEDSAWWKSVKDFTTDWIDCAHNYTSVEQVRLKGAGAVNRYVTRKGAVRARKNDLIVVPLSMAHGAVIARGLENPKAFNSAPHGAGRQLSRKLAKERLDVKELIAQMADVVWAEDSANLLLDEAPDAYKDGSKVIDDAGDLLLEYKYLTPILNYKGT